ncbi:metalloprotease opacity-associated protein A family [Aeromonas diversa CDC 2478-85]|uniref:Metalloprotease opacity-associated protein A family n=1 Tax=Aeromonas diversa CDC 2478-85 TaxID=1268237 RepID=N9U492_9GAMM|nr:murein DD-endopeptidase MepM [Aeromonas diversa]ENY73174.1 metalloprotease opacity-associated protein A family [Aeromonas diversa CDC 2478-85]
MKRLRPLVAQAASWEPPVPRKHFYAILLLTWVTLSTVALLPAPGDILEQPLRLELPLVSHGTATNEDNTEFNTIPDHELVDPNAEQNEGDDIPAVTEPQWLEYKIRSGETLTTIFNHLGVSTTTLYKVLDADNKHYLSRLKPGQVIEVLIDEQNLLQQVKMRLNIKETLVLERKGEQYLPRMITEKVTWKQNSMEGTVRGSFYQSARNAGISPSHIQKIANLFQWRMNLAKELKQGDTFQVLVKSEMVDDQTTGNSQLLGVEFVSGKQSVSAWLADDGNYYDGQGMSLERGFRRYPLHSRYRITSNFNPARKHPITGLVRPHEGTDFATPIGAPVLATGDGVVLKATSHPLAGTYVVIRHSRTVSTRYLHLSKLLVKQGQRVKMGDKIALSGNTGRSTGAHLHYEVRINNRPVDAMKVKLPMAEPLSGKAKRQFLAKVKSYRKQLSAG